MQYGKMDYKTLTKIYPMAYPLMAGITYNTYLEQIEKTKQKNKRKKIINYFLIFLIVLILLFIKIYFDL